MGWLSKVAPDSLDGVVVAHDASHHPVHLRIRGSHTLIIGVTGSGKGSAIASIIAGLCRCPEPWELNFVDLKLGTEAVFYDGVTTRHAYDLEQAEHLLDELATIITTRAIELRGTTRDLEPTVEHPLEVLVIDEAAELAVAWDKDDRDRVAKINRRLDELLRLGRSWGFACIACTQDPRLESFKHRQRFPQRLCLRVIDEAEARMCLGTHAVDMGATPWLLPSDRPGSCWEYNTETGEPDRFRFRYYTDDEIRNLRKR